MSMQLAKEAEAIIRFNSSRSANTICGSDKLHEHWNIPRNIGLQCQNRQNEWISQNHSLLNRICWLSAHLNGESSSSPSNERRQNMVFTFFRMWPPIISWSVLQAQFSQTFWNHNNQNHFCLKIIKCKLKHLSGQWMELWWNLCCRPKYRWCVAHYKTRFSVWWYHLDSTSYHNKRRLCNLRLYRMNDDRNVYTHSSNMS